MTITSEQVSKKLNTKVEKKEEELPAIVNDAKKAEEGKTLLKMERSNYSWTTANGVTFTQDHPYQLVDADTALELKREGGFVEVAAEEVVEYYKKNGGEN